MLLPRPSADPSPRRGARALPVATALCALLAAAPAFAQTAPAPRSPAPAPAQPTAPAALPGAAAQPPPAQPGAAQPGAVAQPLPAQPGAAPALPPQPAPPAQPPAAAPPAAPGAQPGYPPPYGYPPYGGYYPPGYYYPPQETPPPPKPVPKERNSTPVMVAGIAMTLGGAAGLIVGTILSASAKGRYEIYCDYGGGYYSLCQERDDEPRQTAGTVITIASGVLLAAGIPLWIIGGRKVPIKQPDEAPKAAALRPTISIGAGSASMRMAF